MRQTALFNELCSWLLCRPAVVPEHTPVDRGGAERARQRRYHRARRQQNRPRGQAVSYQNAVMLMPSHPA